MQSIIQNPRLSSIIQKISKNKPPNFHQAPLYALSLHSTYTSNSQLPYNRLPLEKKEVQKQSCIYLSIKSYHRNSPIYTLTANTYMLTALHLFLLGQCANFFDPQNDRAPKKKRSSGEGTTFFVRAPAATARKIEEDEEEGIYIYTQRRGERWH